MRKKTGVKILCPAKINLSLEVVGRRPNGYHNLNTIFAKLAFGDALAVAAVAPSRGVSLKIDSRIGFPLSAGEDNLVLKAARAFLSEFGIESGLSIKLVKRIPVGAGFGGGSSDAAGVLKALCALFGVTKNPHRNKKILKIAVRCGADVPFFLRPEPFCFGEGIGEVLTPVQWQGRLPSVVLCYPGVPVLTKDVFSRLEMSIRNKFLLTNAPDIRKIIKSLEKGDSLSEWGPLLFNRLEAAVLPSCPEVRKLKTELEKAGVGTVLMSGSGSGVFGLCEALSTAKRVAKSVIRDNVFAIATQFSGGIRCR